jgi:RHS repeat-associated protein
MWTRNPQVISRADSNGAFTVAPSAISLTYTANGLNQYSAISGGTQTLAAGPQVALTYDPLGRIQSETTSGATSNFLYDGTFLAEEYNSSGTTTARYVPGPGADEPLTVYSGADLSSPNWYAADQEGSTIATANASGAETASYAYGPYGEPLTSGGASAWGGARYRYTGQIEIPGALSYFYKARMYDPGTGRFFQTDPAGFGGGVNIYAYAMNDPINGWDPTGRFVGTDTIDLGGGCTLTEDFWDTIGVGDDGTTTVYGYHSFSVSGCGAGGGFGSDGASAERGDGGKPQSNGRNCSVAPASAGQYAAATADSVAMTAEFFSGLGDASPTFGPDSATSQVMGQSAGVQAALGQYQSTGATSGLYSFGLSGLVQAGANPVAQFVGSFRWSISGNILSVTNTSSFKSLAYDHGPQWQRSQFAPMGNTHQTYNIRIGCH